MLWGEILRIAILEDDADIAAAMKAWLSEAGYTCHLFGSAQQLMTRSARESFDLFILDWVLPESSGVEVLRWLRLEQLSLVPVLFVTVRDDEVDVVEALENGADDFMTKPVRRIELVARTKALVRRSTLRSPDTGGLEIPPYSFVMTARQVLMNSNPVTMTEKEFELAVFLFKNIGKLLSRGHLSESVWGRTDSVTSRTIDTHISRVRKKLALSPQNGFRLQPVYNIGYRLERVQITGDVEA